jgi:hypothetical protein
MRARAALLLVSVRSTTPDGFSAAAAAAAAAADEVAGLAVAAAPG